MENRQAANASDRCILEGVPKVGYHTHLCPFPGSLYAVLQYIRDPVDFDYLMGVTGAAFRRVWDKDDGGNVDLMYFWPEPHQRIFKALRYEFRTVGHADKGEMIEAVKDSITQGKPLISFGIIGPPEAGVVAGYSKDGQVLHGYSYFQEGDVQGYYEKADWFETMGRGSPYGFIVIGDKKTESGPTKRETLISTLEWAVDLARKPRLRDITGRPENGDHANGLAAYDGWANGLEVDADYPKDDIEVLKTRVMVHGDQCCMLEERRNAAGCLKSMADIAPEAEEELAAAASLYKQVANEGSSIWLWGHDMGEKARQGLADPEARKKIASAVRASAKKEAEAVGHLERALEILRKSL
jgi:hypothetical protein